MLALIITILLSFAQTAAPAPIEALDGVDPVLLVGGKETMGKKELAVVRGRFEYWFATPESKAAFEKDPKKYEIQLGGLCARMGRTVRGNASDFAVVDGRIYIFGSDECHKMFVADAKKYVPPAAAPLSSSTEARTRGRNAIARAVSAMGGAAAIDALKTMTDTETHIEHRGMGDVTIATRTFRRFPDAVRQEQDMPTRSGPFTMTTIVLPTGAWGVAQARVMPLIDPVTDYLRIDLARHPLVLLKQRHAKSFEAVSLGRKTLAGIDVELVRVRSGALDVTIGVEDAGLVRTMSFVDRGPQGNYGESVVVYDDYRTVNGVKLPFKRRATFDAAPDGSRAADFSAIVVNAALDPKLFEPAAPAAK